MLDETFKAEWIAALESGEYTQGHGRLWDQHYGDKRMCCLGVAGDLLVNKGKAEWEGGLLVDTGVSGTDIDNGEHQSMGYLLQGLRELIGLSEYDEHKLAVLNDDSDSFEPVIAEIREL